MKRLASALIALGVLAFAPASHASPTPLVSAVDQVRQQVAYNELALRRANVRYSHGSIVAQTALSYVVGHVSAPAYGYDNEIADAGRPVATASSVLATGAGICGHAALTYAAIVEALGFPVRSVQFYYGTDTHIADEVHYRGAWHYFDPTFGAYYRTSTGRIISISEARRRPDAARLLERDDTLVWYRVALAAHLKALTDYTAETAPSTRVELGEQSFKAASS